MERHLHGFDKRQVLLHHDVLHELHEHLRIGVALELHAFCLKLRLDVGIILDDAVMDDGKIVGARIVGMSVARLWFAMRCPTCMSDAHAARHVFVAAILGQVVNLTFCLINIEVAAVANHCHARAVIATIL